ncbi:hypothetical protein DPMN_051693 [Dreissena polymorpha]|uniref:Uncharacterized protein n=1 Tax=Dreissena polymorpha TaxID=45954 RepID=A0A9D4CJU7_DREPO|nr:hypothetical protein DPMN_051693 [Dreissena polymorpha]
MQETDLPKRVFPLNGPRLRMSISATDLLGKTVSARCNCSLLQQTCNEVLYR